MLYELVMRSIYFGQVCINRFNYVLTGTPAAASGSFGLQFAFFGGAGVAPSATSVIGELLDIVSNQWTLTEIETRAIYSATDFYTRPFLTPVVGEQAGDAASPVLAYGLRTNRVRSDIARGTKRFVGVPETVMGQGGVIPGVLPAVQEVAVAMSAVLIYDDEGNTLSYSPCVVQKEKYTTPSGRDAYRYYPTLSEQMEHVALGILWEAYPQVRSQVSRQYGRGS